ncbi:choline BCCT transporter BetT [Saxibacter everestensis]|uniref:Choline BCCT transporter BetT n=1 Tax=Saxibacter everestensis TaxID=2909229 RepID=A0ABY8QTX4_9MICO|nr:choline BCCT transporter BetT [Brevibacteriaceae bacterium ZFBP1038]
MSKTIDSGSAGPTSPSAKNPLAKASTLNRTVFFGSATVIVAVALWAIISPSSADLAISAAVGWISGGFGWYYFLAATIFVVFVVFIAVSRFGRVKLGPEQSKPQFSMFTWASMLFAAGIGIDLMFFSVSEPVSQYLAPPTGDGESVAAARQAVVWTLFHYGITGWAMYALMGMALAYFAYRHNLPLSIRSALYPIFGKRVWGKLGDTVDIAAVLGTIFGIATSLGIGVVQLNYGLSFLLDIPENVGVQIALIAVAVIMATVSVVSGVEKGIRRLSELNVVLAIALMLFILFSGNTLFLLNGIVMNIGDYVANFTDMTMNTFAFDQPTEWLNSWTLFFWAWWIAWAPFVGLFLARISRGRTIRQFVACVLIIPFLFILIWISIFGNSALDIAMNGGAAGTAFGEVAMNQPERAFYSMLDQYPGVPFSASVATFTGLLFYVTSADSGALVMSNFTSRLRSNADDGAKWLRIFWAAATGLLTLGMLIVGGVTTLQNATIIMGLPFSFVMFFIMYGLYKALRIEGRKLDSLRGTLPGSLSERTTPSDRNSQRTWRQRLARSMSYPGKRQTERFIDDVCRPALSDVAEELREQGAEVKYTEGVLESCGLTHLDLAVSMGDEDDFAYKLWPGEFETPSFATRTQRSEDKYYRVEVYLAEGTQGYDITGYSKEQVIGDILDQHERHLHFLHLGRESQSTSGADDDPEASLEH